MEKCIKRAQCMKEKMLNAQNCARFLGQHVMLLWRSRTPVVDLHPEPACPSACCAAVGAAHGLGAREEPVNLHRLSLPERDGSPKPLAAPWRPARAQPHPGQFGRPGHCSYF